MEGMSEINGTQISYGDIKNYHIDSNTTDSKKRKYQDVFDNKQKTICKNCAIAHTECIKQEDDYCKRCMTLGLDCRPVEGTLNLKKDNQSTKTGELSTTDPKFERRNSLDFTSWSFLDDDETKKIFEQSLLYHQETLDFNWNEDYSDESMRKKVATLQDEVFETIMQTETVSLEQEYENNRLDIDNLRISVEEKRKKRDEYLGELVHENFSFSFEHSKLPMMFMDTEANILSYNETFRIVFNLTSPLELYNKTLHLSSIVTPSDFQNFLYTTKKSNVSNFNVAFMTKESN
eukprot:gene4660-8233_t